MVCLLITFNVELIVLDHSHQNYKIKLLIGPHGLFFFTTGKFLFLLLAYPLRVATAIMVSTMVGTGFILEALPDKALLSLHQAWYRFQEGTDLCNISGFWLDFVTH